MKILTVVYSLEKGGTQRAAQNFAEGYALNGHDSKVLATQVGGIRETELTKRGVHVWVRLSSIVLDKIEKWQPAVIHLHSHGLKNGEVEAILARVPTAKVVETNVFSNPSPWKDRLDNSFQLSNWCDWLYQKRSEGKAVSAVVPYPVRIDDFYKATREATLSFRRKHGLTCQNIILGRIGQHFDGKWSPLLIDTFEYIRRKNDTFRLLVVNAPGSIINRINKSKFKDSIILIDQVLGDDNLRVVYSSIDIFALVADQGESFGMVLAEALLCETPIVALSTPWADNSQCEVVGHLAGGLVVTTPKGLADAILLLADDQNLRKTFGAQGRQRIIDLYDYRKIAECALINAYQVVNSTNLLSRTETIVKIYADSFDRSPFFSKNILRFGKLSILLRYINGYQPWSVLFRKLPSMIMSRTKRLVKHKPI